MTYYERRSAILEALSCRRHDTMVHLANEFGVSVRTIRRDIEALSLSEPLYTKQGRYGGGVYLLNGRRAERVRRKALWRAFCVWEREWDGSHPNEDHGASFTEACRQWLALFDTAASQGKEEEP